MDILETQVKLDTRHTAKTKKTKHTQKLTNKVSIIRQIIFMCIFFQEKNEDTKEVVRNRESK
jgi:hypothetical protein